MVTCVFKIPALSDDVKTFLLRLFALIGFLALSALLLGGLYVRHMFGPAPTPKAPASMVLELDFTHPLVERPNDFALSLDSFMGEEKETPLFAVVRAINAAKDDPHVKGIVAKFNGVEAPNLTQAQEIATALKAFRTSGKFTMSFAPSYGTFAHGSALYYLASQFQDIWLQPVGSVSLTGVAIEAPFLKTALASIGVQGNFMQREEYKSAMENATRDSFSPPVRENMTSLIKNVQEQVVQGLSESLKIAPTAAQKLVEDGPYTSGEASKAKLITRLGYADEWNQEIKNKAGAKTQRVDPETYLSFAPRDQKPKAQVALVYAEGILSDAPQSGPARLADDAVIDTDALAGAFEDIAKNPKIKAILFRINSPGGSPSASETIRRAMIRAKETGKPVFVSMGQVAASGGYWIAMDADTIVADPATLTGSIGVLGGKFVLGGLYDKLGIKWDTLSTADNALLWTTRKPFGPKEQAHMNAMLDETYQTFLTNVSNARKIPMEKMSSIAKGRVFTGEQALKIGLVDELGGMDTAVAAIKRKLNIKPEEKIALELYPPRETARETLIRMMHTLNASDIFFRSGRLGTWLAPLAVELTQPSAVRATLPVSFDRVGW